MNYAMVAIDLFLGAVAVIVGAYLVIRGRSIVAARLRDLPSTTLLWLGLVLLTVVGGSLLAAGVVLMADCYYGRLISVVAGAALAGWGAMLLTVTGYRHWLQVEPLVLGMVVVVLSFFVPVPG